MGVKLLWTGVTVWVALPLVMHTPQAGGLIAFVKAVDAYRRRPA